MVLCLIYYLLHDEDQLFDIVSTPSLDTDIILQLIRGLRQKSWDFSAEFNIQIYNRLPVKC